MIFNSQGAAELKQFINGGSITPGEEVTLPKGAELLGDLTIEAVDTEAIRQEGYNAGYEEGHAAGSAAGIEASKTILLLHGDSIKDSSAYNHAVTNNGVTVSTDQSKFGGKSLYLNGAASLSIESAEFLITNGDFTIDWWQYKQNTGTFGCLNPWIVGDGYSQFLLQHGGGARLYSAYNNGDTWAAVAGAAIFAQETGVWIHWAIVKKGTTLTTYRNGAKYWSGTISGRYTENTGGFILGRHAAASNPDYFKGYVDELRISRVARWTANFTPPTEPYQI